MSNQRLKDYKDSPADPEEEKIRKAFHDVEERINREKENLKQWAQNINQEAQKNPWPLITGVGFGALLVGIIIGSFSNDESDNE